MELFLHIDFFLKKNDRKYAFYTTFKSNLPSTYINTSEEIIMLNNENTFFIQFCNHRNCYVISSNYSTSHKKKFKNVAFSLSELSFLNCNFFLDFSFQVLKNTHIIKKSEFVSKLAFISQKTVKKCTTRWQIES